MLAMVAGPGIPPSPPHWERQGEETSWGAAPWPASPASVVRHSVSKESDGFPEDDT